MMKNHHPDMKKRMLYRAGAGEGVPRKKKRHRHDAVDQTKFGKLKFVNKFLKNCN